MRDLDAIPYRWTGRWRRAAEIAARQRARIRHRACELWPSEGGQSTSGLARAMSRGRFR